TEAQIADTCAADPAEGAFPPRKRLLLRLVDELHDTSTVSDALSSFRREPIIAIEEHVPADVADVVDVREHPFRWRLDVVRSEPERQPRRHEEIRARGGAGELGSNYDVPDDSGRQLKP